MSTTSNVTLILIIVLFACVTSSRKTTLPPKRGSSGAHSIPAVVPGPAKQGSRSKSENNKCPKDAIKFGACGSWLGLLTEVVGTKPSEECCTVVKGLADFEAALCLCTVVKTSLVSLDTPLALSLLLNGCGKNIPDGFLCA